MVHGTQGELINSLGTVVRDSTALQNWTAYISNHKIARANQQMRILIGVDYQQVTLVTYPKRVGTQQKKQASTQRAQQYTQSRNKEREKERNVYLEIASKFHN